MPANSPRYQPHKGRGHWYVIDTTTGVTVMTGMAHAGALQLADRLNRNA